MSLPEEIFKPLSKDDCPLLPNPEAAAARYNDLLKLYADLQQASQGLPGFEQKLSEVHESLSELRSKMKRTHYRVGFLGTTGAGKSTTFNNILGVTKENAPAKSGGGEATTAAPARLRRLDPPAEPQVRLDYMTYDEYEQRRKRLTGRLGLDVILQEDGLLEECRRLREQLQAGVLLKQQLADVLALESLVLSYKKHPELVSRGKRVSKPGIYADRSRYLNHSASGNAKASQPEASELRLIWEVAIDFPNTILPKNLEMVDLPGLGATSFHDTCVTLDIIENKGEEGLDGAIIFMRADQLSDDSVIEIITTLQSTWGRRFNGRVWIVYNKFDSLTEPHFLNSPNFFYSVDKLITDKNIPKDCVFVTCNELLEKFKQHMTEEQRIEAAGNKLKYAITDKEVTQHLTTYPYFEKIIRDVYATGGIDGLREAMGTRLGRAISAEVDQDVSSTASALDSDLRTAIRTAERRRTQSKEDVEKAAQCARVVNRLIMQVRAGLPELKKGALEVRNGLTQVIGKFATVDDLDELPTQDVQRNFQTLANRLDADLPDRLIQEGVGPAYTRLGKDLNSLPELPLGGADSIQKAWAKVLDADSDPKHWSEDLPRFDQRDLIDQICTSPNALRGPEFKHLLLEQINVVSLVSLFRVRERLLNHLGSFSDELKLLINQN